MFTLSNTLALLLLSLLYIPHPAQQKDSCAGWEEWRKAGKNSLIFLQICEDISASSAYYRFKNNNPKAVRISFQIEHQNGKTTHGSTRIKAQTQSNDALCTLCAKQQGGGNIRWTLTKIAFEGEAGFW